MGWKLDKNRPICPQIAELLTSKIAKGEIRPNERLMSVREVAVSASVNPNTVQKAFEQLERQGLIYSVRGIGWFVAEDTSLAVEAVKEICEAKTRCYFSEMEILGFSREEMVNYIKEWSK